REGATMPKNFPSDLRVSLTVDQALEMLPEGEAVHTFRNGGLGLFGADWGRPEIIDALRSAERIELAGEVATSMGHGIAVLHGGSWLFIETKTPAPEPTDFDGQG